MSYEVGSSAYVQTTALTGKVIADDQYQAAIGVEPYTMILTAGANVTNTVVESGGSIIASGGNRHFENITVSNGGLLKTASASYVQDLTVLEGGSLNYAGNINFVGTGNNVAQGCFYVNGNLQTSGYIENGVVYNIVTDANACYLREGAVMSNCTATGMNVIYESSVAKNVTYQTWGCSVGAGGVASDCIFNGTQAKNRVHVLAGGLVSGGVAQSKTVVSNAGVVRDLIMRQTATMLISKNAVLSGGIVSGGTVSILASGSVCSTTISSGASMSGAGIAWIYDLTVADGGKVTFGNGTRLGGSHSFAAGALTDSPDAYTVDGVIHDLVVNPVNLHFLSGTEGVDVTITGHALYISAGAKATNVRIGQTGPTDLAYILAMGGTATNVHVDGNAIISAAGGVVNDVTVSNGGILRVSNGVVSNAAILAGGTAVLDGALNGLTVAEGGEVQLNAGAGIGGAVTFGAGAIAGDADAYAADGAIHDLTVETTLNVFSGLNVSGGTVDAGGTLNLSTGVVANDVAVAGSAVVSSGAAFKGGSIADGGTVVIGSAGVVSGVTVLAGGSLSAVGIGSMTDTVVEAGGHVTLGHGFHICGKGNSFASGALTDSPDAYTVDGVIHDLTIAAKNIHLQEGADAVDAVLTSNELYVSAKTSVTGLDITGGKLFVRGGTVTDIDLTGGSILETAGLIDTLDMTTGVLTVSGATARNITASAGAVISAAGNGRVENAVLKSGAKVSATAAGATFAGLTLEDGAKWRWATGIHLSGTDFSFSAGALENAGAAAYTDENGAIHNLAYGGIVHLHDGVTLIDAVANGNMRISEGGIVNGVTAGTGSASLQGGTLLNANIDKAKAIVISRDVLNRLGGAETNVIAGGFATYADMYAESGVLYNLKLGAATNVLSRIILVDGITASAPVISSGGTLFISSGAGIDGATIEGGARLYMSSGATVKGDVTVASTAYFYGGTFAAGATVDITSGAVVGGANLNAAAGSFKFNGQAAAEADAVDGVIRNVELTRMGL